MGKKSLEASSQQKPKNTTQYMFKLRAMQNPQFPCHFELPVCADFNPFLSRAGVMESSLPVFNHDRRYWTKSFVTAIRKDYYLSHPSREKQKFAEKYRRKTYYQEHSSQKSSIFSVMPIPKSLYCNVCSKTMTLEYHEHIKKSNHLKQEQKSIACSFISDLVQKYRQTTERTPEKLNNSSSSYFNCALEKTSPTKSRGKIEIGKQEHKI